jgi:Xaa-Pro aminopeptidase
MLAEEVKNILFIENRQKLCEQISKGVVIVAANSLMQKCDDESYPFSQESSFLYLCGIDIPNLKLLIDCDTNESWIVVPTISDTEEWFSGGLSVNDIKKQSGVNHVINNKEFDSLVKVISAKSKTAYYLGQDPYQKYYDFFINPAQRENELYLRKKFKRVKDLRPVLNNIRAIKSDYEVELMSGAIAITNDAFKKVKTNIDGYQYEYQVEATFDADFKEHNSNHAFTPIIASGKNACTLHYIKNNDHIEKNELLLMDIGARHNFYNGDVSRTYIVGEASHRQVEVFNSLVDAKIEIEQLLKPGVLIASYEKDANRIMISALNAVGLDVNKVSFRDYFPHAISHGLGVSTHEPLGLSDVFLPGMILTVEPGIYIREESIGMRIEDDILITETGHKSLSGYLPTSM